MATNRFKYLLVLFLALTVSQIQAQKSQVYKNKKTQMRVKFPCDYTSSVTKKEKYTTYKMDCKDDDVSYVATVTAHKVKMTGVKGLLKVSLDAFSKNFPDATIIYTKDWKIGKQVGTKRQMLFKGYLLNYYVIMKNDKQYQLIVFGDKDSSDEKKRDDFIKSFKML